MGHFSSDIVETKHVEPRVQNKGVEPVNKREKSFIKTKHVEPRIQNQSVESVIETKGKKSQQAVIVVPTPLHLAQTVSTATSDTTESTAQTATTDSTAQTATIVSTDSTTPMRFSRTKILVCQPLAAELSVKGEVTPTNSVSP